MYYKPVNANASVIATSTTGTKLLTLMTTAAAVPLDYDAGMNQVTIRVEDATDSIRVLFGVAPTATKGYLILKGTEREFNGVDVSSMYIASTANTPSCSVMIGKLGNDA